MIRFVILWIILSSVIYVLFYVFKKEEVEAIGVLVRRISLCFGVTGILITLAYLLNNIQGV